MFCFLRLVYICLLTDFSWVQLSNTLPPPPTNPPPPTVPTHPHSQTTHLVQPSQKRNKPNPSFSLQCRQSHILTPRVCVSTDPLCSSPGFRFSSQYVYIAWTHLSYLVNTFYWSDNRCCFFTRAVLKRQYFSVVLNLSDHRPLNPVIIHQGPKYSSFY